MDQNIWACTGELTTHAAISEHGDWIVTRFDMLVTTGSGNHQREVVVECEAWGKRFQTIAPQLSPGCRVHITAEVRPTRTDGLISVKVHHIGLLTGETTDAD